MHTLDPILVVFNQTQLQELYNYTPGAGLDHDLAFIRKINHPDGKHEMLFKVVENYDTYVIITKNFDKLDYIKLNHKGVKSHIKELEDTLWT